MSPSRKVSTIAEQYDRSLQLARMKRIPADQAIPKPTAYWPDENIELLERYQDWLLKGGASELVTNNYSIPMTGHVLGLTLKPHHQLDLEIDLDCALDFIKSKQLSNAWIKNCRNALLKFKQFLRHERGLGKLTVSRPFDVRRHASGLPDWLVTELKRYLIIQQRNWRSTRLQENISRFWSGHLRIWRFLCFQCEVHQFQNLECRHILEYIDHRLTNGYAVSGVNGDISTFRCFLRFLKEQGYNVRDTLLNVRNLKKSSPLPKFLSDDQVKLLRDHFEQNVQRAKRSSDYRDAVLDHAAFYLLWQGGMRLGEVEDLRMDDLDLQGDRLYVRNSKGLKDRTVYLTEASLRALKAYLDMRGEGTADYVFLYRNRPLKKDLIRARIKVAGEQVGVKVYPHRLRHTCATQLLNAGCRVTSIQRFLGHESLNTTMIYARVHDRTVAKDYFTAMNEVEAKLQTIDEERWGVIEERFRSKRAKLQGLLDRLTNPDLDQNDRLEMVSEMQEILDSLDDFATQDDNLIQISNPMPRIQIDQQAQNIDLISLENVSYHARAYKGQQTVFNNHLDSKHRMICSSEIHPLLYLRVKTKEPKY